MSYVIQHTDTQKFVTFPGAEKSYIADILQAWQFHTREAAEKERCPNNEQVYSLQKIMGI